MQITCKFNYICNGSIQSITAGRIEEDDFLPFMYFGKFQVFLVLKHQ